MGVIYSNIESEIVTRLQPLETANFSVVQLPQVQAEFEKTLLNGRVTVAFNSSKAGKSKSTSSIFQEEEMAFEIIIQAKKLRDSNNESEGLHAIAAFIKSKLVGYSPTHCSKMWFIDYSHGEYKQEDAVWIYSMTFGCNYQIVEDVDESGDAVLLQQITYTYNGTDPGVITNSPDP
jgi:hypothetical protein